MVIRDLTPKAFLLFKCSGGTIGVVCSSVWEGGFISGTLFFVRVDVSDLRLGFI